MAVEIVRPVCTVVHSRHVDGELRKIIPCSTSKKASELMTEAGYADGFMVTLETTKNRYVNDQQIAQALASMLG